jgi:hypothetical protein
MKNLHDAIKIKQTQITQLQKELDALRLTAKILAEQPEKQRGKKGAPKQGASLPIGTVVTQPLMVRSVLLDCGIPLHVDQISEDIKKKYGVSLEPQYLTSIIYRLMKKGKLFRKAGPNTFGLLELPNNHTQATAGNGLRVQ